MRPRRPPAVPGRFSAAATAVAAAVLLAGCGEQSVLEPESDPARQIETLWWWMLAIAATVLGGAVFLLGLAWIRRREPGFPIFGRNDRLATALVVVFGIFIPLVTNVVVFVAANFVVAEATDAPEPASTDLTIEVVGNQWWWDVEYPGSGVRTANEIHIPVGARVNLEVRTDDVIHSFWVPRLNRKIDMFPNRLNRILLVADEPGRYRGQCAEFCGEQHALMGMLVVAQPPEEFAAWQERMAADAREPSSPAARRGRAVFMDNCASCHTVRGTAASGDIGPDLTHLQERSTLAALAIPNDPGSLAAWVVDPQAIKPGNRMPDLDLGEADTDAVLAYLEELE